MVTSSGSEQPVVGKSGALSVVRRGRTPSTKPAAATMTAARSPVALAGAKRARKPTDAMKALEEAELVKKKSEATDLPR